MNSFKIHVNMKPSRVSINNPVIHYVTHPFVIFLHTYIFAQEFTWSFFIRFTRSNYRNLFTLLNKHKCWCTRFIYKLGFGRDTCTWQGRAFLFNLNDVSLPLFTCDIFTMRFAKKLGVAFQKVLTSRKKKIYIQPPVNG